jgi:hypothetical protein
VPSDATVEQVRPTAVSGDTEAFAATLGDLDGVVHPLRLELELHDALEDDATFGFARGVPACRPEQREQERRTESATTATNVRSTRS